MRIAFVSDNTYPWFSGGIEKRRYIIMRKLAEEGHDVHCFTMHRKEMPGREFTFKRIKYHTVAEALGWQGMYRGGSRRRSVRMPLIFAFALFLKIWPYRFDVLDADSFPFLHLFPLYIYTRLRGIRYAITWHEVWSKSFWKGYLSGMGILGYWAEWLCSRMADVHLANVSTTKTLLIKELNVRPRKIIVFPVAVDSKTMRDFTAKHHYRKKRNFVVVSRLVEHKRVWLAINAIGKTDATLTVVGIGPDLAELQRLAAKVAPGRVVFEHLDSEEKLYRTIMESQALIMPSRREGLSLVTIEALALGVPVVVADTSSLPAEIKQMCLEAKESELSSLLSRILANTRKYSAIAWKVRGEVLERFSGDDSGVIYERVARSGGS